MNEGRKKDNVGNGVAMLQNLAVAASVLQNMAAREGGLPGIGVLYGAPGRGKTYACTAIANQMRGYYVQVRSAWNRKTLLEKILFEMGVTAENTIAKMLDQICEQIGLSRRPLIIDEFDFCLRNNGMIELVRDIYEGSQGTMLLVGEENIPQKLKKHERFHSRVLAWVPALPVSIEDAKLLCKIYCQGVTVDQALLEHVVKIAHGSVRRVCVNLSVIKDVALRDALDTVDLAAVGEGNLYTGEAPVRRG
ncbi:MAG: ATP-binding protein [Proteobacteria bacterium]|nr:ATP-binding protein [Pseudomonadota bacterium]MCL2306708.1 ATP-binding protein [Pseudomonadota bacterium]